jgi:hypothetical protein
MKNIVFLLLHGGLFLFAAQRYAVGWQRLVVLAEDLQQSWLEEYRLHRSGLYLSNIANLKDAGICLMQRFTAVAPQIEATMHQLMNEQQTAFDREAHGIAAPHARDERPYQMAVQLYWQKNPALPRCNPNWFYRFSLQER